MREARAAEQEHRPADAVALYQRAAALAPTSRLATTARRRLAYFASRDEGGYAPLAALLAFRGRLPAARTREVVHAFEREATGFPEGRVRREARLAIGEAWLEVGEPARAEEAFRALLAEPTVSASETVSAQTGIARALAARSGAAAGAAHLEEAGLEDTSTHAALEREARRVWGRALAWAVLALFVIGVGATGGRELARAPVLRRAFSIPRLVVAAYVVGFPAWLAQRYDSDALDTFALVALASGVLCALASWGGEALRVRHAAARIRLALAASAVAAHLAAGYLALDRAGQLLSFA